MAARAELAARGARRGARGRVRRGRARTDPGLTWIGHATFLARLGGVTFLTDPVFSHRASPLPFAGPQRMVPPGVALRALPARRLRGALARPLRPHGPAGRARPRRAGRPLRGAAGMAELVASRGRHGDRARVVAELPRSAGLRVTLRAGPALLRRGLFDRNRRLWAGFVIEGADAASITRGTPATSPASARSRPGSVRSDLALLPIGAYAPRAMMRRVHMDPDEAVRAALDLQARPVDRHALRDLRPRRRADGRAATTFPRRPRPRPDWRRRSS